MSSSTASRVPIAERAAAEASYDFVPAPARGYNKLGPRGEADFLKMQSDAPRDTTAAACSKFEVGKCADMGTC